MRKRCQRKVWPLANNVAIAIEGACIMSPAKLSQLELLELQSVEAFRVGNAGLSDWKAMADLLNLAETMAKDGIGPEVIPVCNEVQERLIECKERFERTGKMGTSALGLKAFRELQSYHALQRSSVDLSTYERAIRKTINRIRSSHPDLKVLQ